MDKLRSTSFDGESSHGTDFDQIFDRLNDPNSSNETAKNLVRFVLHRLVVGKYSDKLKLLNSRLGLSDIAQSAMKSIFLAANRYKDFDGDEIRLIVLKLIQNKVVDAINKNLGAGRDVRRESPLYESNDSYEIVDNLPRSKQRHRELEGVDSPPSLEHILEQLAKMSREQAIEWIQVDFSREQLDRFEVMAGLIPESHQLAFGLVLDRNDGA
ncbi:MAG: hypothetical protein R3C03_13765 [Pirellulaceae bacterium]